MGTGGFFVDARLIEFPGSSTIQIGVDEDVILMG
jgi:hypothetical protein